MSSSTSSSSSSSSSNHKRPVIIGVDHKAVPNPSTTPTTMPPPPPPAAPHQTPPHKQLRPPPAAPIKAPITTHDSVPATQSMVASRVASESESGSESSSGEEEEGCKTPVVDMPATQGAVAVPDDDFMFQASDFEAVVDEPQVEVKVKAKPSSSRKKTTKPAESKPRAEAKSSSASSKRSRSGTGSRSKAAAATVVVKNDEQMANTNLRISEILQKTKWLPKITENVIKKFELLEEGDTIVVNYWTAMPTSTGKVYLLISMDARKWWGNRDVATYIDAGNLKLGTDYLVIQRVEGKLLYGQIAASAFK